MDIKTNAQPPLCRECLKPIANPRTPNTLLHDDCKIQRKRQRDLYRFKALAGSNIGDMQTCPQCRHSFAKSSGRQTFCSRDCQYQAKLIASRKPPKAALPEPTQGKGKSKSEDEDFTWPQPEAPQLHPGNVWFVSFNWRAI